MSKKHFHFHIAIDDKEPCPDGEPTPAQIMEKLNAMTAQLDRLAQEVSEIKTVADSAISLLGSLAQQVRDLKDDPAALEALANDLDAKGTELAGAVAANTIAADEPPVNPDA